MNIEIVDFYQLPEKRPLDKPLSRCIGTLHVYICDLDIDLRGLPVFKNGKRLFISMPRRKGIDPDTKEQIFYPIFNFANHEKQKQLIQAIIKEAVPFIQKKYVLKKKANVNAPARTLRRIPVAK